MDRANKLVQKFGTRDPFAIAKALGVHVLYRPNFQKLKGMYKVIKRQRYIFINEELDERMQRIVCAHELAHDQLHQRLISEKETSDILLYNVSTHAEYEANIMAAELLIDTDVLLHYVHEYGYTAEQIAMEMETDINIIAIKVDNLRAIGYDLQPVECQRHFLR